MPSSTHHVSPNPKGGWSVRRRGGQRASRHFATKKAAEAYGRQVSFNQQTVLIVHHADGSTSSSNESSSDRPKARRRTSTQEH
ncbi:DUF2188 domain-containing protein [Halomonas saccharevitans]|uniref:DUF2188 domain-containing protein n=1 Tax=Halomonas saccharevitans TaxID=416872 RepID=A0ABU3NBM8_9GAMM|nr:DUF2188 domain-containing protein [Halomonas saccharevitans]MDT8878040.1 DUF2188 domain-containing protein [Halomonas saccharevitans]